MSIETWIVCQQLEQLLSFVSIIASCYVLFSKTLNNKLFKGIVSFFIVLNIIVQYVILILSESRGAIFGFTITFAIVILFAALKNIRSDKISLFLRVTIAFCLSLIFVIGVFSTAKLIQMNKARMQIVSAEDAQNTELDTGFENFIEDIIKTYTEDSSALAGMIRPQIMSFKSHLETITGRNMDRSTGRSNIWKAGFAVFLERPIFGWTREGLIEPVNNMLGNKTDSTVLSGGLHNIYLTVLCSSGIVGFVTFIVLIGIVFFRFFKRLFNKEKISMELLFSFAMSFYFLISDLVESRILYTVSFFNVVFWIYFGYLNHYSKKEQVAIEKER